MQTTTAPKAGNAPDLLQGILSVQVRNEDKITEQDRVYCQTQQNLLYKTLDQIDRSFTMASNLRHRIASAFSDMAALKSRSR